MKETSYLAHSPTARQWAQVAIQPHHGIAIPLFSLHSAHSYGIGEFTDLPLLIDWCASVGFDVIQLLPLNDTEMEISPYSAISAFALNPMFLGIASLPYVQDHPFLREELKALPQFSDVHFVNYLRVREHKERFLRHYFQFFGPQLLKSKAFDHFVHRSRFWLKGYAAFKILKKRHQWLSWETWPEEERVPTPNLISSWVTQEPQELDWYYFLQFLCDQQLEAAKTHASLQKVLLMGDIPILVNRDSADVWLNRELFDLEFSAGAPPDLFNEKGQNWGFPIYRWKTMSDQNDQWWVERIRCASRYYHMYRIDHIVGFFRLWSIPLTLSEKQGHFIPQDETTWIEQGQRILLKMLQASDMLPIGEDLGIVPHEVKACLNALGICGTRVMRWERKWETSRAFIHPQDYPVVSMTTVSTHDTETLQQWWRDNPIEAQLFAQYKGWLYHPILSREYHREILWDSHHSASLFHINPLQEYLALIPGLSWPNPDDERINIPGLVSDRNWSYRLNPSLEQLFQKNTLEHLIRELIK